MLNIIKRIGIVGVLFLIMTLGFCGTFEAAPFTHFDAAVGWLNDIYFFCGNQYYHYEYINGRADPAYAKPINNTTWPDLGFSRIDAAVALGGKVYFFSGNKYVQYDIKADRADKGYPALISKNWPGLTFSKIDAAVAWPNNKVYFFSGDLYIRYDVEKKKADKGYPAPIAGNWPGLSFKRIDAVTKVKSGKVYFFSGNQYIQYDMEKDRADEGYPKTIDYGTLPGVSAPPLARIDDAIVWDNGKAYFFCGNQYIQYDIKTDRADMESPAVISDDNWPGQFTYWIDAAVNWGNGKAYFFHGPYYIRYDIKTYQADKGYPAKIAGNWPGLNFSQIDAAVNWGNGKAYFFSGNQYIRYDIKADRADPGYPKYITPINWKGLSFNRIDAVINWGNGKAYFFSGNWYIRYDIKADRADPGYPKLVDSNSWPGVAFDIPKAKNLANWMNWVYSDKGLAELSIPGTHNTCALIDVGSMGWARCQDMGLKDQLENGIRFLDIRCKHSKDHFSIYHGKVFQKLFFDDVLKDCYDFLGKHPSECILMSVSEEGDSDNPVGTFEDRFNKYVKQNPSKWFLENRLPKLSEVRGKIVLIRGFDISDPKNVKNMGINNHDGRDSNGIISNPNYYLRTQNEYNYATDEYQKKWSKITKLFDNSQRLDPNVLYINYTSAVGGQRIKEEIDLLVTEIELVDEIIPAPREMADRINPPLWQYVHFNGAYKKRLGIVVMDFPRPDINSLIIDANL